MRNLFFLLCLLSVSAYGQGVAVRSIHGTATNLNLKSVGGTNGLTVNTNGLVVTSGSRVGIGELSPDESLEVFGNIITAPTGSVGTVSVPATNMVSRQLTVVGSGPGQVNLTGTNGGISTLEAGSPVDTNNTLRLPKNSVAGVLISTNVDVDSKTNQSATVPLAAGQYLTYNGAQYVASNLPSASAFPLTADANAAGFDITNLQELAIGPIPAQGSLKNPGLYLAGTNNSGQNVTWWHYTTNSLYRWDASVNGGAYVNAASLTSAGIFNTASAINAGGNLTAGGTLISVAATGDIGWVGRSFIRSPADGQITLRNSAGLDFRGLLFRDATAASPALIITNGIIRVGDGTGNWATPTNALFFPTTIDTTATTATNIHRQSGCVRLAAGQQSYIITNMYATTTAVIIPSVSSDDATLKSVAVIRGAGFFQLKGNAAAGADCDLCWFIASP